MSTSQKAVGTKKAGRPVDSAKRDAILDAAANSFFAHGFGGTAIEQVASDAGVSKVTVYNHFGDKHTLFKAAVEKECEKLRGYFSIENNEGNIRTRLTAIGHGMVAFLSRPEMVQFERRIAAETDVDPNIGMAFLEAGPRRMKALFTTFLAHAHAQGELDVPDPQLASEQFACLCKGMGDLERRFGADDLAEINTRRIEGAVELFLAAYSPR